MKKKRKSLIGIVVLVLLMCSVVATSAFADKAAVKEALPPVISKEDVASPSDAMLPEEVAEEEELVTDDVPLKSDYVRIATDSNAEFIPIEGVAWAVDDHAYEGEDYPGWGTWDADQLTEEQKEDVLFITARIFKDGEELGWFNSDDYSDYADYRMYFTEPGEYTFQAVYQMSNNWDIPEDAWSEMSEPYIYNYIGVRAPVPTGLKWDQDGTMRWDDVQKDNNYVVRVYKKNAADDDYQMVDFAITNKNYISRTHRFDDPDATYKFTVTALGDLTTCDNSEESPKSEPFFVGGVTDKANAIINDLINSDDLKNAVENTALSQDELDAMKLAVQADAEVAENLKALEDKYRNETGKEFGVTSDSNLVDQSQVSVIGGSLNGAESISFKPAVIGDNELKNYKKFIGLNISLEGETETGELKFPVLITMPVPAGIDAEKLVIYHYDKQGNVLERIVPRINGDGTVSFAVTSFSDFAFVDTTPKGDDSGGGDSSSGGGGGSSSGGGRISATKADPLETPGTWIQDMNGWWLKKLDGTYPVSQWLMNGGNWYRFDDKGYMMTGWYTDTDGKKYYLNPVSDGTQGAMKLGWQLIDGKWYYFNQVSDGTRGALLVNTTTPDGFTVGADGVWIQ